MLAKRLQTANCVLALITFLNKYIAFFLINDSLQLQYICSLPPLCLRTYFNKLETYNYMTLL